MSAVEEIQAAIDKLTEMKAASTQPTGGRTSWMKGNPKRNRFEGLGDIFTGPEDHESRDIATHMVEEDAELVVTLHRTIDAQLAILHEGLKVATHFGTLAANIVGSVRIPLDHALALARAINGGTQ